MQEAVCLQGVHTSSAVEQDEGPPKLRCCEHLRLYVLKGPSCVQGGQLSPWRPSLCLDEAADLFSSGFVAVPHPSGAECTLLCTVGQPPPKPTTRIVKATDCCVAALLDYYFSYPARSGSNVGRDV
jgi:hypothetical protein